MFIADKNRALALWPLFLLLLGSLPVSAAAKKILIGKVQPAVDGLYYETPTQKGYTVKGKFRYVAGESVTFSCVGVVVGSAFGAPAVTPLKLDVPAVAANQLHFLQAVDRLPGKAGLQLPAVGGGSVFANTLDFADVAAVARAAAQIKPGAILPGGDPADSAVLASAENALAAIPVKYRATTFETYHAYDSHGETYTSPAPGAIRSIEMTFDVPFGIQNGAAVTTAPGAFSGSAVVTFWSGTISNFTFKELKGQAVIGGVSLTYEITAARASRAKNRALELLIYNGTTPPQGTYCQIVLIRDPDLPNTPPQASYEGEQVISPGSTFDIYNLEYGHSLIADCDGRVRPNTDVTWEIYNGDTMVKTVTGPTFTFQRFHGQKLQLVLTVQDDEGAQTVKKRFFGQYLTFAQAIKLLTGKLWLEFDPGADSYYLYQLAENNKGFLEYRVDVDGEKKVTFSSQVGTVSVRNANTLLKHVYMPSVGRFVYEGDSVENPGEKIQVAYDQTTELPPIGSHFP